MSLIWDLRAQHRKEVKREGLLVEAQNLELQNQEAESTIAYLRQRVKEYRRDAVTAREQEFAAKREMDRSKSKGANFSPKQIVQYEGAKEAAEDANRYESEALRIIQLTNSSIAQVPEIPASSKISLTTFDLTSVAFFVLLDMVKLNKWWVLTSIVVGFILMYIAEHYDLLEKV